MEKIKCRVCGFEWTPTKEDHYIARANEKARILVNDHSEPALYDAWDCPVCGAQFAVEGRKRTAFAGAAQKRTFAAARGGDAAVHAARYSVRILRRRSRYGRR